MRFSRTTCQTLRLRLPKYCVSRSLQSDEPYSLILLDNSSRNRVSGEHPWPCVHLDNWIHGSNSFMPDPADVPQKTYQETYEESGSTGNDCHQHCHRDIRRRDALGSKWIDPGHSY